jgi:hypothetical protein
VIASGSPKGLWQSIRLRHGPVRDDGRHFRSCPEAGMILEEHPIRMTWQKDTKTRQSEQ